MALTPWEILVERYKGSREPCNCRQAWYMLIGEEQSVFLNGEYHIVKNENSYTCRYGCSANQLFCKNEIAERICEEFGIK